MPDHRIRLRAGWDCHYVDFEGRDSASWRVDLPTTWGPDTQFPLKLVRQFGRPPVNPDHEQVFLELRSVPGLQSVRLNGLLLDLESTHLNSHELLLPGVLLPRNAILLEVTQPVVSPSWGEICLRITPRNDSPTGVEQRS